MSRRTFLAVAALMTVVALAVRWHNAMTVSVVGGYDAFAHFTYVWFLAETGRVPLADSGWEFFQPPLFYAFAAGLWRALQALDGDSRLRIALGLVATLGVLQAGVAVALVRRTFPSERVLQLLAAGLVLFVPVHLYSAGFLGNEGMNAVLCSFALLALVRVLERPSTSRAALLGTMLGLAMLTKFTAVVVVAAAGASLGAKAFVRREVLPWARALAVALSVAAVVCGWFYARNIFVYGDPFHMSREQLFLARVENSQLQGRREWLEYVLFDPGILYRPQWPRGLSLNSPRPPGAPYSPMRESIPTGLYANTWFDGFGGFALPPVTYSEGSRRAGQVLLTLGLVPTAAMAIGLFVVLRALLVRRDWDDAAVVSVLALAAMAAVLVHGTRAVPTQAAVKATYLMPVAAPFAYLLAIGAGKVLGRAPRLFRTGLAACVLLAVASVLVFTSGLVIDPLWMKSGERTPVARNLRGVIAYAAGRRDEAARQFEAAALSGWHLGYENLAALALERGDLEPAAWFLMRAAALQPAQTRGTREERWRAMATTQAEYANSLGLVLRGLGRTDEAIEASRRAVRLDPTLPEAHYDLGLLELELAGAPAHGDEPGAIDAACAAFARAVELDPAFLEARRMRGVCLSLHGDCDLARSWLEGPDRSPRGTRAWPVETGPGDLFAAGLHRRRHLEPPAELLAEARRRCSRP